MGNMFGSTFGLKNSQEFQFKKSNHQKIAILLITILLQDTGNFFAPPYTSPDLPQNLLRDRWRAPLYSIVHWSICGSWNFCRSSTKTLRERHRRLRMASTQWWKSRALMFQLLPCDVPQRWCNSTSTINLLVHPRKRSMWSGRSLAATLALCIWINPRSPRHMRLLCWMLPTWLNPTSTRPLSDPPRKRRAKDWFTRMNSTWMLHMLATDTSGRKARRSTQPSWQEHQPPRFRYVCGVYIRPSL